jgi:nitroreductase
MKIINERRSIRSYEDRPVEPVKIEKLLRAAMQAPSAANQQPWEFIVVRERAILKKLADLSPYSKMLTAAPLAFVLLGNREKMAWPQVWQQDLGAAAENLLLEAVELGLGAVWLGVAPMEERMSFISELFGLKDTLYPFCVIPVGYPAGKENTFVDRYDQAKVHFEKY